MKEKIKIERIIEWTNSRLENGPENIFSGKFSIDSRIIEKGDFFIPLKGENFDGHDFIEEALKRGAGGFVYERDLWAKLSDLINLIKKDPKNKTLILNSENNLKFLMDAAKGYLRLFNPTVIGVTGSAGKTTVKNFLVNILKKKYEVKYTPGNYNTEIGVSKTIFDIDRNTEIFIAELGMRGRGQIKALSEMCNLDIGAITAICDSHLEFFKSIKEIAAAKAEISLVLEKNNGVLFLNNDDSNTEFIKNHIKCRWVAFGRNNNKVNNFSFIESGMDSLGRYSADIYASDKKISSARLKITGFFNLYNACCAAGIGSYLKVDAEGIRKGLEETLPANYRMEVLEKNGKLILIDCYNANPLSVRSAADSLMDMAIDGGKRPVAIIGDMLELGKDTKKLHFGIGKYLREKGVTLLVTVGKFSRFTNEGFVASGPAVLEHDSLHFDQKDFLKEEIKKIFKPGDVILIKGSRANKLEDIIDLI